MRTATSSPVPSVMALASSTTTTMTIQGRSESLPDECDRRPRVPCPQVQFPTAERRNASAPPPVPQPNCSAPISAMSRRADGTRRWTADLLAAIRSVLMQAHLRTAASHVQG